MRPKIWQGPEGDTVFYFIPATNIYIVCPHNLLLIYNINVKSCQLYCLLVSSSLFLFFCYLNNEILNCTCFANVLCVFVWVSNTTVFSMSLSKMYLVWNILTCCSLYISCLWFAEDITLFKTSGFGTCLDQSLLITVLLSTHHYIHVSNSVLLLSKGPSCHVDV